LRIHHVTGENDDVQHAKNSFENVEVPIQ